MSLIEALVTTKVAAEIIDVTSDLNNSLGICLDEKEESLVVKNISVVVAFVSLVSFYVSVSRRARYDKGKAEATAWLKRRARIDGLRDQDRNELCVKSYQHATFLNEARLDVRCSLFEDVPSAIFNMWMLARHAQAGVLATTQLITLLVSLVGIVKTVIVVRQLRNELTKSKAQMWVISHHVADDPIFHRIHHDKVFPAPNCGRAEMSCKFEDQKLDLELQALVGAGDTRTQLLTIAADKEAEFAEQGLLGATDAFGQAWFLLFSAFEEVPTFEPEKDASSKLAPNFP